MRRGFTILEVMIALIVMSIGLVALYSLQIVAIDGNVTAQEFTQATGLAERWVEKLRRDSISWTNGANLPASLRRQSEWLDAFPGEMTNKDLLTRGMGRDILDPRFCIKYRATSVPPADPDPKVMRVDVRVLWPRRDSSLEAYLDCPAPMMEALHLRHTWQVSLPTLLYRHES